MNSGGLGVERCSRLVVSAFTTVRNRLQPFACVRGIGRLGAARGKLLERVFHGSATCQILVK